MSERTLEGVREGGREACVLDLLFTECAAGEKQAIALSLALEVRRNAFCVSFLLLFVRAEQ